MSQEDEEARCYSYQGDCIAEHYRNRESNHHLSVEVTILETLL